MGHASQHNIPPKSCAACGRAITWRRKWARDWANVRYCSDACRRRARSEAAHAVDAQLEASILSLLARRAAGATICPSEAARAVGRTTIGGTTRGGATRGGSTRGGATDDAAGDDAWRALMEPARAAARRLMARGQVEICQGGRVVPDPSRLTGPIRVRRRA